MGMPMVQIRGVRVIVLAICMPVGMGMGACNQFLAGNVFMFVMDIRVGVVMGMDGRFMNMQMLVML